MNGNLKSFGFRRTRIAFALAGQLVLAVVLDTCHAPQKPTLTVSVAASLRESVIEAQTLYQNEHGAVDFRNNFGASGTLAREIEQGAPVDVFLSAAEKQMDQLQKEGLIEPASRTDLAGNTQVLIAPRTSGLKDFNGLASSSVKLIALGDPASVPVGHYGKEALTSMHLYDKITPKIILAKDVRQVLTYVETGNADAGLVYATDARTSKNVRVVEVAPVGSCERILYSVAEMKATRNDAVAREFIAFLTSPEARAIFVRHGFAVA